MRFGSATYQHADLETASGFAFDSVAADLGDSPPKFATLFVTAHFEDEVAAGARRLAEKLGGIPIVGCTAEGIVGADREIERQPAVSLLAGSAPGAWTRAVHVAQAELEASEPDNAPFLDGIEADPKLMVLLADPFSFNVAALLALLSERFRGCPVVGGMASGADEPGQNVLVLGDETHREGAVLLMVGGDIDVETVVSQGCRPIGERFIITSAERNVVRELGGKQALAQLVDVLNAAPARDQNLAQNGLFIGRAVDEHRPSFGRGDFLVRNVVGVDRDSGAIAVGDLVRVGITVQFHVRDADTAHEDLDTMLRAMVRKHGTGALLFTCNGRGTRMWPEPNHDVRTIQSILGPMPLAGMFCAGECGPIGGRNFIHGHTASLAVFRPTAGS
jgi:small ligand-binding sensory domain FIST